MSQSISNPLRAFLDLIAWSEGTSSSPITKDRGYDVIVTGAYGPSLLKDYSEHPFATGGVVVVREKPYLASTAAGRYQLLARYWRVYKQQLKLPDFSPTSQDAVAIQQMKERGVTAVGNTAAAIIMCSNIWASFPGNTYGQGGHSLPELVDKYDEFLAQ